MTPDELKPRTAIERGPVERLIDLDPNEPEFLPEAGGDTAALDSDTNVGGAPASAGLDSGGAVGVSRGVSVGRPGFEYTNAPHGERTSDVGTAAEEPEQDEEEPESGEARERELIDWATRVP